MNDSTGDKVSLERIDTEDGSAVYIANGPIFFGSALNFEHLFSYDTDPKKVELHLEKATVFDYSGFEALNSVASKYERRNKTLRIR